MVFTVIAVVLFTAFTASIVLFGIDCFQNNIFPAIRIPSRIVLAVFTAACVIIFINDLRKRFQQDENDRGSIKPIVRDGVRIVLGLFVMCVCFIV